MSLWSRVNRLESRSPDAHDYQSLRLALQEFSIEELRQMLEILRASPHLELTLEELREMLLKSRATKGEDCRD